MLLTGFRLEVQAGVDTHGLSPGGLGHSSKSFWCVLRSLLPIRLVVPFSLSPFLCSLGFDTHLASLFRPLL